jgi:hypothetical protein
MYQYTIYTREGGSIIISHRAPNTLEPALSKILEKLHVNNTRNA